VAKGVRFFVPKPLQPGSHRKSWPRSTAAEGAGKTLAEWLRELALKAARERPADPTELVLAEVSALRYMLLNLFHATAQANAEGKHLLPDSVVKIRDQANARKLADARKLLAEFLSQEGSDGGKQ
jgi:hypothetical protein